MFTFLICCRFRKKTQTVCTCDGGEEDAHQQREGGGDVSKHIRLLGGCRMCGMRGFKGAFLHHVPFAEVGAPQVLYGGGDWTRAR